MIDELPEMIGWVKGEGGLLLCVVEDVALRQSLLQFINLNLAEGRVVRETQLRQLSEIL